MPDGRADLNHAELNNGKLQPPATAGGSDLDTAGGTDWAAMPFLAALKRIHVTDLKHGLDGYGREIFIEEVQFDGKPTLWYQFDKKGILYRKVRDSLGISIKRMETPWIAASVNDLRD